MRWYWGLAALAVGAGAGASLGAVASSPCDGNSTAFCGPKWAALTGGTAGLLLVGMAGFGAALDPRYRSAGLTAGVATTALIVASAINVASGKS